MGKTSGTAAKRLRDRLNDLFEKERKKPKALRKTPTDLAATLGMSKSTMHELLNGQLPSQGSLHHLDAIAAYFNVTPTWLIRQPENQTLELQPQEYRTLTHLRAFEAELARHITALVEYIGGLLPEEHEARRFYAKYRRIRSPLDRQRIERTIDEILHGQRIGPTRDTAPAAQDSSGATGRSTRAPVLKKSS